MKIYQNAELSADPTNPMSAATKQYVDQQIISGAIVGGVFFTNISPTSTGIVGSKQYVANTVPANKVITDGTTDTANVRINLVAEGGSAFYSPTITLTSSPNLPGMPMVVSLTEDTYDKRMFAGQADLTGVDADVTITATSSTNATATCIIHRAAAGPTVSTATIGAYPGAQTEAKSGDVMTISGTMANAATYIEAIVGGAVAGVVSLTTIGAVDSGGAGLRTFSGSFTVSSASGLQSATVRARNTLGTFGTNFVTTNNITLNQTFPAIGARTITYPASQSALKDSETATVAATVTNADTVAYTSSADLSVETPNTYSASKTVTRVGGSYVVGTNNYTITATKASNGAVTVASSAIAIANIAATAAITITGSPARLISSAAGQNYVINITPNQVLQSAPTLVAGSGTWTGAWTLTGNVWSRTLVIADTDTKGATTFSALTLPGKAAISGSTISSGAAYSVGGFVRRTLTFAAFSQTAAIGTNVVTIAKTSSAYAGGSVLALQASTANVALGYTITDVNGTYDPTGGYLFITDAAFAGANTSGTLQVEIEEVV